MKKLLISLLTIIVGISMFDIKTFAIDEDLFPQIPNLLVYSLDSDEIVYNKNGEEQIYPASVTKVMTAIVAMDKIQDMNEKVTIQEEDLYGLSMAGASVVGLQVGHQVSYSDLLSSLLIISAGDSAQTLANHLFGSQDSMVETMNVKAKEFGMNHTNFMNVTGLHEDEHYSTTDDLLILMKESLKNKDLRAMMSTMKYSITVDGDGSQLAFSHTIQMGKTQNEIIENYITGGKTGSTIEAGSNLASFGEANGISYIVIVMGVNSDENSFAAVSETKNVFDYLESKYQKYQVWDIGDTIAEINVLHSWQNTYKIEANETVFRLIDQGIPTSDLECVYRLEESYEAPLKKGDVLGYLDFMYEGELQNSYEILMDQDIDYEVTRYYFEQLMHNWYLFVLALVLFIVLIYVMIKHRKEKNRNKYRL